MTIDSIASGRRTFLRTACGGLCACGLGSAEAAENAVVSGQTGGEKKPDGMAFNWIKAMLEQADANLDPETARKILKGAYVSHWEQLGMDKNLAPFIGKLDDFLDHISAEWGWKIDFDKAEGVIRIDEAKSQCVCPIIANAPSLTSKYLCYCSEGFSEAMFSAVVQKPVNFEVTQSILRGAKSCRHTVTLPKA